MCDLTRMYRQRCPFCVQPEFGITYRDPESLFGSNMRRPSFIDPSRKPPSQTAIAARIEQAVVGVEAASPLSSNRPFPADHEDVVTCGK